MALRSSDLPSVYLVPAQSPDGTLRKLISPGVECWSGTKSPLIWGPVVSRILIYTLYSLAIANKTNKQLHIG